MYTINNRIDREYYYEKIEMVDSDGKKLYGVRKIYTEFESPTAKKFIPCQYEDIKSAIIYKESSRWGVYYTFGFIVTQTFDNKQYMGLLSEERREIIPCNKENHEYAYIGFGNTYYSNCLDVAKYDNEDNLKYGLITLSKQFIYSPKVSIPCDFTTLSFNKKRPDIEATMEKDGKTLRGILDYEGEPIKPMKTVKIIRESDVQFFDYATDFNDRIGIALVGNEKDYFYINTFGKRVSNYYRLAFPLSQEYASSATYNYYAIAYDIINEDILLLRYDDECGKMEETNINDLHQDTLIERKWKERLLEIAKLKTYIASKVSTISEIKSRLGDLWDRGKFIEGGYDSECIQFQVSKPEFMDSFINGYQIAGRDALYHSGRNNFFYRNGRGQVQKHLGYWHTIASFNKNGYAIVSFCNKESKQEYYIIDDNGNVYETPIPTSLLISPIDCEKERLNRWDYTHNNFSNGGGQPSVARTLDFEIINGFILVLPQLDPILPEYSNEKNIENNIFVGYRIIKTEEGYCYQNLEGEYILNPGTLSKGQVQSKIKRVAISKEEVY